MLNWEWRSSKLGTLNVSDGILFTDITKKKTKFRVWVQNIINIIQKEKIAKKFLTLAEV